VKLKPISPNDDKHKTKRRKKHRRPRKPMRTIAILPTLLTLGNLCFGFAAVYFCGRQLQDLGAEVTAMESMTFNRPLWEDLAPSFLSIAVWMIIIGMICDTLDGRVARGTGQASKFGSELDSLADTVTFGLAPAMMMVVLVRREITEWGVAPLGFSRFGEMALLIGFIYTCCTALRLARFNVETSISEAHHEGFRGLPSPGAAAAVVSTIFLHEYLEWVRHWKLLADVLVVALPALTLVLAWLMVSRVPFRHAASAFFRRRPFWHMAPILLAFALVILYTELVFFIGAWAFVLSGPVKLLTGKRVPEVDEATESADASSASKTGRDTEQSESENFQEQYPKRQIHE